MELVFLVPIAFLLAVGVFVAGAIYGRNDALREHRRQLDAGREYLRALDEATRPCIGGTRLEVGIVVTRAPEPAREGYAKLRVVDGKESF